MPKNSIDLALDEAEEILAARELAKEEPGSEAASEKEEEAPIAEKESDQEEVVAAKEPEAEPQSVAQQQEAAIEPPQFWSAEKKEHFAKAPKEVQQAVLEYEQQRIEWANRLAMESKEGRNYREKIEKTFEPYANTLKEAGIEDPIEAAAQLLEWNSVFEKDPLSGLLSLMQENGVTFEQLQQAYYQLGGAAAQPREIELNDPRIDKALAEAQEAKKLIESYQQKEFLSEVNRFKEGKDSSGNVRKQFAELYAPQIAQAAQQIQAGNPTIPLQDALSQAYEAVLSYARKTLGVTSASSQTSIVPEKAKAAASSVVGAPSNGAVAKKPKPKSIDEAISMAEDMLGAR